MKVEYKELRFVIGELTSVYVLINDDGGMGTLGPQGWHHKAFPPSKSVLDIMGVMFSTDDCILWPKNAPDPHQPTKED